MRSINSPPATTDTYSGSLDKDRHSRVFGSSKVAESPRLLNLLHMDRYEYILTKNSIRYCLFTPFAGFLLVLYKLIISLEKPLLIGIPGYLFSDSKQHLVVLVIMLSPNYNS